jgi:hypothetical protein
MNEFDDDDDNMDLEEATLDIEKIKANIHNYKIEKICEIIVCNRYFNFNQDLTVGCMQELSRRRENGDLFKYEEYIENSLNELPKLDFTMPDLRSMLNQAIGNKKK